MTVLSLIPNDAVAIGIGACFGAMSRYQVGQVAA
jgi:fluoride ion exporter CrcB/FEX